MFKKEVWDALKRGMECFIILGAVPVAYIFDQFVLKYNWEFNDIFEAVFFVTIVLFSVYAGATLFQSEKKDRAFEYLFSLPLSRIKILLLKLLPRMIILILLIIISNLVFKMGIIRNGFIFIFLFFVSVFLSIGIDSIMINLTGVLILYILFDFLWLILMNLFFLHGLESRGAWISSTFQFLATLLILIPIGTAFWLTFKKMDVKPIKLQMRTYYAIVFPTVIILIVFVSLMLKKYVLEA